MQIIVELSEVDLLARMRNFEDHFVERKTVGDEKDWKKTAVAFANSAPVGLPAVLYIGVRDNGDIETPQQNLDEVQKKFNRRMQNVYPRIAYVPKIISEGGRQALAVIIPGSVLRPHFAGLAYVRRGSETHEASEEQFADLIAQRSSKSALILKSKGETATVITRTADSGKPKTNSAIVVDCNHFYVTLQSVPHIPPSSFPLGHVEISYDNLKRRLQLEIADAERSPWDLSLEQHVQQVVGMAMTRNGQLLLKELLLKERIENGRQFLPQIPIEVQNAQLKIAIDGGIVRTIQEPSGLRTSYFIVVSHYQRALQIVLAEQLK